jgi:Protein of unknown function (DUF3052)
MGADQIVDRMGFATNQLVLEVGLQSDCDQELRESIKARVGSDFISNEATEVVDSVIIWWREEDGDLVDELVDALTFLTEDGPIWVLTPKVGRPGHVEASDIQDAAPTAGLSQTISLPVGSNWTGTKLVHRKGSKK